MKKMMKVAAMVAAMVLTAGVAACQEKIPPYLIVDGTTITGCDKAALPANLVIPRGITKIAGGAFAGCDRLESVTIPGSVRTIGEDITFEEAVDKNIYEDELLVFYRCGSLRNVTIEKGVKTIGFGAFYECESLTSVTIPSSVTTIGEDAFYECESLTSVTIPSSVTTIGEDAFDGCDSLVSVTIPNSVKEIGENAFHGCEDYAVTYKGSLKDWCAVDWDYSLLSDAKSIALSDGTDPRKLTRITAGDLAGVARIGRAAFYDCESLASIEIPKSVKEIGYDAFSGCEDYAVTYKGSLKDWCAADWDSSLLRDAESIALSDGTDPRKLTRITAGDLAGVARIGRSAFDGCTSLVSVTIPDSVTEIGRSAFGVCTSLASVSIPDSVTIIGELAFANCTSLASVFIPDSVTTIGELAFATCESLVSIEIPNSVKEIGDDAFRRCKSLESVTIPDSVKGIGDGAFGGCTSLSGVTIPNSVTTIGKGAFSDCLLLASVTIPNSVTTIGDYAFSGCKRLKTVNYNGTKEEWEKIKGYGKRDLADKVTFAR